MTNRRATALVVGGTLLVLGLRAAAQRPPVESQAVVPDQLQDFVPVTDGMLLQPAPENWISFRNGYSLWGYSPLSQINAGNVGDLRLVWSRAMRDGPQEVEPLVYNGVMFLANVEDIVQALDATTGDLLWEYRRNLPDDIANVTGTAIPIPQRFHLRRQDLPGDERCVSCGVASSDRRGPVGNAAGGLPRACRADDRPDRRQGQAHHRFKV